MERDELIEAVATRMRANVNEGYETTLSNKALAGALADLVLEEAAKVADGMEWSANQGAFDKRQSGRDDNKECAEAQQSFRIAAAIRALKGTTDA